MVSNPFKIYEFRQVTVPSGLERRHSILDLGCGKGHWTLLLAKHCRRAIGIDTSKNKIGVARRFARRSLVRDRVKFICSTLEGAHLEASSLDRIFSFCVLEHIPNLHDVLGEIHRLLKPGGQLHVSVDSLASIKDEALLRKHAHESYVVQYFTEETLRQQLKAAGFEILEITPILTGEVAQREFERRIKGSYKKGLVERLRLYRQFHAEDRCSASKEGVILIARAQRPMSSN